jgi:hypothetical protein
MSKTFFTPTNLLTLATSNGGFTYDFFNDELVKEGFAVPMKGTEVKEPIQTFDEGIIQSYLDWFNQKYYNEHYDDVSVGCWFNPRDQHFYLDVVEIVKSKTLAIRKGMLADQKSIYDLTEQKTIWLPERQKTGTNTQQESYLFNKIKELAPEEFS